MALTDKPTTKTQLNVYVPPDLDAYVEEIRSAIGLSKSDFIQLLLAYSRKFHSLEDIKKLAGAMMIFGDDGLEPLACQHTPNP